MFEDGIFADKEDTVVEKKVATAEEKVIAEEEEVAKNEKEREEEDSVVNIVTAPESAGENTDNLERAQARLVKVSEVASPTQEVANDVGVKPETEEQSEDRAKPKENKRKCFKDKKLKREDKKRRRKKHRVTTSMAEDN
ncbi:hypothetical protein PVK06_024300 [Gossypium arboreum]|uniref:Uncharacterized protein n=1 Tax=Gossypium arboreum TaxID=29729 RepID=A0ABR0PDH9_GOSAR|nr:hypothetical protein PVK06_024300 [Gossypium arboreum]